MAVIMLVIMYMVGLLDHDMHLVMFASDNQPGYGLDFYLSIKSVGGGGGRQPKGKKLLSLLSPLGSFVSFQSSCRELVIL